MANTTPCSCSCGDTVETCKCPATCACRQKGGSCCKTEKAAKLGLWDRIRAKRERGATPAKAGDKDYPDSKSWKKVTSISEKQSQLTLSEILQASLPVAAGGVGGALLGSYGPLLAGGKPNLTTSLGGASAGSGLGMLLAYKNLTSGNKKKKPETEKNEKQSGSPAWQKAEGKNDAGGLNAKGRASYNKATGGNLKPPVTESNPTGDRAGRQNSFCARMCGMKKHETGSETKKDPDSRINKSLRKWNCKCSSALEFGEKIAAELSSTSIGNSTNPLPGSYTGKVKLPINGMQSYAAHAANLEAGNSPQPAQRDAAGRPVPQHILAPPTGRPTNPGSKLLDQLSPPSPQALAGRQVDSVASRFDSASGELGRNYVADMATPGTFTPMPGKPGGFVKTQSAQKNLETEEKQSMANLYTFGAKLAKSMCSPCDMPNGPTNKKHMTGASPAVLEADEKSEEIGKPPVTETEHSEAEAKQPEEGVKAALLFGQKIAANYGGVRQNPGQFDLPQLKLPDPRSGYTPGDVMTLPAEAPVQGPKDIELPQRGMLGYMLGREATPPAGSAENFVKKMLAGQQIGRSNATAKAWANQGIGPEGKDPLPASMRLGQSPLGKLLNIVGAQPTPKAPLARGTYNDAMNVAKADASGADLSAHVDSTTGTSKATAGAAGDSLGGYGKYLPYAAGGLGAAGLAGLAYHLMNQKKKKKRDGANDDDNE